MEKQLDTLHEAQTETETPLLMTVQQAAQLLGVGHGLLYRMIARRSLPHLRMGQRVLIPRRELETWLANQIEVSVKSELNSVTKEEDDNVLR